MSSAIQNLMNNVLGDGARNTKFDILFPLVTNKLSDQFVTTSVKSASFPAKSHDPIVIKHKGRPVNVRGISKFTQTWDCTFYLTADHALKAEFELWIEALSGINNYMNDTEIPNLRDTKIDLHGAGAYYFSDIIIWQSDFEEKTQTAKYTLKHAFPTAISPIQTTYEGASLVQEFTVTFAFSHFIVENTKGSSDNFIDSSISAANDIAQATINSATSALTSATDTLVNDTIGAANGQLNSWMSGMSKDIISQSTTSVQDSLNKGGVSPELAPSVFLRN